MPFNGFCTTQVRRPAICVALFASGFHSGVLQAQSDPSNFSTVIDLPPETIVAGSTIESDTQVNVSAGGFLDNWIDIGRSDRTSVNVEVNLLGGAIGDNTDVYAGGILNLVSGTVGTPTLVYQDATANIFENARVDGAISARLGGNVNVFGGTVASNIHAQDNSLINIMGGTIGSANVRSDSNINIHGGHIGILSNVVESNLTMDGGTIGRGFDLRHSSTATFTGSDFRLNGNLITTLDDDLPYGSTLSGVLADGSVLLFTVQNHPDRYATDLINGTVTLQASAPPNDFPELIYAPSDPVPQTIRPGQTLTLASGAAANDNFKSLGASLVIDGGSVGDYLAVSDSTVDLVDGEIGLLFYALEGSVVNVSGGTIGKHLGIFRNSIVNVSGGEIGRGVVVFSEGTLNVSNGNLAGDIEALNDSTTNITGGEFGSSIAFLENSYASISGGHFTDIFSAREGSEVDISGGVFGRRFGSGRDSDVEIFGGEFELNGVAATGLVDTSSPYVLTGTLADGSVVIFSPDAGDNIRTQTLTISLVPLTPPSTTPIDLTGDMAPPGLREGQLLNVLSGGELPDDFAAVKATMNIQGGTVGNRLEVANADVNISDGSIGSGFYAFASSDVQITGGIIGDGLSAFNGVSISMTAGAIGNDGQAYEGSTIDIAGGSVGGNFSARTGSTFILSGGILGSGFSAEQGSTIEISGGATGKNFNILAGSNASLVGGEFRLNGEAFVGSMLSLDTADVFSGTLVDGSTFVFTSFAGDAIVGMQTVLEVLPPASTGAILVDSQNSGPRGLRPGEILHLEAGGSLADNFAAIDSEIQMTGGEIGGGLELADVHAEFSGGVIYGLSAYSESTIEFSGASLDGKIAAYAGSQVNIQSGVIGGVEGSSAVVIHSEAELNVTGGQINASISAQSDSTVNIFGTEFSLNGQPLTSLIPGEAHAILDRGFGKVLSGLLTDGTEFEFALWNFGGSSFSDFFANDSLLTITLVGSLLTGDYNADGFVSQADLDLVLLNWGDSVLPDGYDPNAVPGGGPFDGLIGQNDLDGVLLNWGNGTPPSATAIIPEPSTAGILIVILGVRIRRNRRSQQECTCM